MIDEKLIFKLSSGLCVLHNPRPKAVVKPLEGRYCNIWDAYDSPSCYKVDVWNYWRRTACDIGGYNLRITSRNTFIFCIAFEFIHPHTMRECTACITPSHSYFYYTE